MFCIHGHVTATAATTDNYLCREDYWQISSDFVCNSCIHLAILADKDDGFKENVSRTGAYLMKDDSERGTFIRDSSTAASFMKRLEGHAESSKLTSESDKDSNLYSLYPHEAATEDNKTNANQQLVFGLMVKPKGLSDGIIIKVTHWRRICLYRMQSQCQGSTETKLIFTVKIRSKSVW